jgi:integrase
MDHSGEQKCVESALSRSRAKHWRSCRRRDQSRAADNCCSLERAISENTLSAALRRLGYSQEEVTSHGFRATASTLLNESGKFSSDSIERALAHQDTDEVRRASARGVY